MSEYIVDLTGLEHGFPLSQEKVLLMLDNVARNKKPIIRCCRCAWYHAGWCHRFDKTGSAVPTLGMNFCSWGEEEVDGKRP